jgi:hypothetical protein
MRPTNTAHHGIDSRIVSMQNEEKVLTALHRFGWLPVRQIAAYCWPDASHLQTTRRTVTRLLNKKQVQVKGPIDVPDGSRVFALATAGVRRARDELGLDATLEKDFGRRKEQNYLHRCLANDFVIWWNSAAAEGNLGAWSEHEVATLRAPVSRAPEARSTRRNKIPDAVVAMRPTDKNSLWSRWLGWVEVERGYKNGDKQEHMVRALCDILAFGKQRWEVGTDSVLKFVVVVCPRTSHELRLLRDLQRFLPANQGNYDAAYIKDNLFVWRPDGTMQPVRELLPEVNAAAVHQAEWQKMADKIKAEVHAISAMHAQLRAQNGFQ